MKKLIIALAIFMSVGDLGCSSGQQGSLPDKPEQIIIDYYNALNTSNCELMVDLRTTGSYRKANMDQAEATKSCEKMFNGEKSPELTVAIDSVAMGENIRATINYTTTFQGEDKKINHQAVMLIENEEWKIDEIH